jgi:deoxyribonuclease V
VECPEFPKPRDLKEAQDLQRLLAQRLILQGEVEARWLAALDASHPPRGAKGISVAAVVLWDHEAQRVAEVATAALPEEELMPYRSGFLSFREVPLYLAALRKLAQIPELLLVDGQGIAHPRRLGIAAHLGLHLDLPSIGVAKSLLYGVPEGELPREAGSAIPLKAQGELLGWVYRSRSGVRPLILSPGHRIGCAEVLHWIQSLPSPTRLPEPLREAHRQAGLARRALSAQ